MRYYRAGRKFCNQRYELSQAVSGLHLSLIHIYLTSPSALKKPYRFRPSKILPFALPSQGFGKNTASQSESVFLKASFPTRLREQPAGSGSRCQMLVPKVPFRTSLMVLLPIYKAKVGQKDVYKRQGYGGQ